MNPRSARSVAALAPLAPFALGAAFVLSGRGAAAQATAPQPTGCASWDVEYALVGNLELTDTPMGQGDGVYPIGPGTLVVRFDDHEGEPGGAAKMVAYEMRQRFTVASKTLFWKTRITNDAVTRGNLERCGATEGMFHGPVLDWATPVRSFRTDGTLTCEGSFCGSFGAPPPGQSPMHLGPNAVDFKPFRFGADRKTFTMASTFVARTESPKQTAHLALSGREVRRTCQPKGCM
jgi:hypothetical protein